ncbi:MAG: hypothetical protein O3A75_06775 [Verrucomicrobia bacterium]|nr:hypothetical protein [Verrucomicrobiota bacterium]MDA1203986.1 hypothetical protein [Verrucomicrobiota bacterium]
MSAAHAGRGQRGAQAWALSICSGTARLWWINDGLTPSWLAAVVVAGGGRALLIRHMF